MDDPVLEHLPVSPVVLEILMALGGPPLHGYAVAQAIRPHLDVPRTAAVDEHPLTLEEIGQRFGLTRERVRQIKEKALRKLRQKHRREELQMHIG